MKRINRRAFAAVLAGVVGMLAGAGGGCDNKAPTKADKPAAPGGAVSGDAGGATGKTLRVAMLPKKKGVPYFTSCSKGAEEAAKELGIELVYDGPTDGSPEKAASMIERWTAQGFDVIAVSPNDPAVLAPAMRAARAKGVHD